VSYCSRQFSFFVAIRLKQPSFNEDGPGSRRGVSGTSVVLKRLGEVAADDLSSPDAIIVESPVYVGNMSGEGEDIDNWGLKFGLGPGVRKMRNKTGAAFSTGASVSNGKEVTILTIFGPILSHQMIIVSGGMGGDDRRLRQCGGLQRRGF
jgi:NADPH-dependent FMN reductase